MVQINPGAFLPQDVFTELNLEDLEQVLGPVDPDMMELEFAFALDTNRLETVAVADLILVLLLRNNDEAAAHVTERLCASVERQGTGVSSYQWLNTLTEVIPYAVVMEKWDYLNCFLSKSILEPAAMCGLLTLAAHVCLAKGKSDHALNYLLMAKEVAARDSLISTVAIDDLVIFAESKSGNPDELVSEVSTDTTADIAFNSLNLDGFTQIENNLIFDPTQDEFEGFDQYAQVLRKWQLKLGGKEQDCPWSQPEDLSFFFQRFRPDGAQLEQFCTEMECPAIVPRLLEIFRATEANFKSESVEETYFIVRSPQASSDEELLALSSSYLKTLRDVANILTNVKSDELESPGLQALSNVLPTIAVSRREAPMEASDFQVVINEELHNYFERRTFNNNGARVLKEALYTMACDYSLVHYILWPLTQAKDERQDFDPFEVYFELWKRGVDLRFEDHQSAILYVTDLRTAKTPSE